MKPDTLFPELNIQLNEPKPVNVASVPQRSLFRYPGGKTWFVPIFRRWLRAKSVKPTTLIEPFVGGGIISLTALFEDLVSKVIMVEKDDEVAAVWQTIVNKDTEWLTRRILTFDLTREAVTNEISKTPRTQKEKAFQTILKNRTFHGGILADGSGLIKNGENGKGIRSRWYPATLAKRLLNLSCIASRIDFRCDDGLKIMGEFSAHKEVVYFIDPPYTAGGKNAGKRLYRHSEINHKRLFDICDSLRGDFLMTYDNAGEVKELAQKHGFQTRLVPMSNTHHATMAELVIGRNLSWMDRLL